jgi:hypothetical protein
MRLTKGQLKRIIREEYSRLKRQGLINEMGRRGQFSRGDEIDPFHRGGDRSAHEEFRAACGGDPTVMMCFDHVMNDMQMGAKPARCAAGLEDQPFMVEWDEMISCLADCTNPQNKKLLNFCLQVEEMLF